MAKKKNSVEFAVKSTSFEIYSAFRTIAEDIGYVYNSDFSSFDEHQMNHCECVYFSKGWEDLSTDTHGFSFSNLSCATDVPVFDLDTNFKGAVVHARAVFDIETFEENKTIVVEIETEEGEDYDVLVEEKTGDIEMGGLRFSFNELRRIYDAALSTITYHLRD
jgi:hypothetical protein